MQGGAQTAVTLKDGRTGELLAKPESGYMRLCPLRRGYEEVQQAVADAFRAATRKDA